MTNIQDILAVWALFLAIIWGSPTVGTTTKPTITASSTPTGMVIKAPRATITIVMDEATSTPAPEVIKTVPMPAGPAGTPVTEKAPVTEPSAVVNGNTYSTGGYNVKDVPEGQYTN